MRSVASGYLTKVHRAALPVLVDEMDAAGVLSQMVCGCNDVQMRGLRQTCFLYKKVLAQGQVKYRFLGLRRLFARIAGRAAGKAVNLQCLAGTAPVTKRSRKKIEREQFSRSASPRVAVQLFGASIHDI